MAKADTLSRLSTLNELLVSSGVSSSECAEHARQAINCIRETQAGSDVSPEIDLKDAAERLVQIHFGSSETDARYAHWHVPAQDQFDALWVQRDLIELMKQLSGRRLALFLVTGLSDSICPEGKYWTVKRRAQYAELVHWIEKMLCDWASSCTRLQVVIL